LTRLRHLLIGGLESDLNNKKIKKTPADGDYPGYPKLVQDHAAVALLKPPSL
jgi:hypothetical protein